MKMKLYLDYREYRSGGEICEGEDPDYEYASHEDEHIDFCPLYIYTKRTKALSWNAEEISEGVHGDFKSGDSVYLAVIRYGTGSTFGCTCGQWKIEGVFSSKELAETHLAEVLKDASKSLEGYCYWDDYFGGYEDSEVYPLIVDENV